MNDSLFAVLIDDVNEIVDIVEFGYDEYPMWNRGWSWRWVDTANDYQEAKKIAEAISFDCTVYRLDGSDPSDENNYRIESGNLKDEIFDERGKWFVKDHFPSNRRAEEFIKSSARWCDWNLGGGKEAYLASLPKSAEIQDDMLDVDLLGTRTLEKIKRKLEH